MGFAGAYVGSQLGDDCDDFCIPTGVLVGVAVGESLGIPLGVHSVGGEGSLAVELAVSLATAGFALMAAEPTNGVSFLALPLVQLGTTIAMELSAFTRAAKPR